MSLSNLKGNLSSNDIGRVRDNKNKEYEDGFENESVSESDEWESLFDDFDSDGDSLDLNGSSIGGIGGSIDDVWGNGAGGVSNNNSSNEPKKPDMFDRAFEVIGETFSHIGALLISVVKSISNRTADDFGYLSRNIIIVGAVISALGFVLSIVGGLSGVGALKITGLSGNLLVTGTISLATGIAGLGISAIYLIKSDRDIDSIGQEIDNLDDIEENSDMGDSFDKCMDNFSDDFCEDIDDYFSDDGLDDYFGEGSGNSLSGGTLKDGKSAGSNTDNDEFKFDLDFMNNSGTQKIESDKIVEEIDLDKALDNISSNSISNRATLLNSFVPMLEKNTPTYADRVEIEKESEDFLALETMCLKALANVMKVSVDEVESELYSAYETLYCYELKLYRNKKVNKPLELANEILIYFKDGENNNKIHVEVDIVGDFYNILVTKGENALVTYGDVLGVQENYDYFRNEKNMLPFVTGITEKGKVLLGDARDFETMMIAGRARFGKSWYLLSVLLSMAMTNTPEEVQFIIVDPKDSNLLKTFSLLPHVIGFHEGKNIIEVMRDIVENEEPRRKKLLREHRCDNIWVLREKGIKLPVIFLVIDEIITVKEGLGTMDKEFSKLMLMFITKYPYIGIRLIFVPHRATGVIDKTNRSMVQFSVAVGSKIEDVRDVVEDTKWKRHLTKPGESALRTQKMEEPEFVKGVVTSTSDYKNTVLMETIAKAYYKMGVDMPDMSHLKVAYNRNEQWVREELYRNAESKVNIQYEDGGGDGEFELFDIGE